MFIPQYGGGALLVREITRRTRRGWPTMLLLALAYALIEEGLTNQTLFNPNYAGQRLLDYGFIPALGTSFNFTLYLLTLHVVWSVGSSVALVEALAGSRWREPWLHLPGLLATTALFVLGCIATTVFTLRTFPFVASVGQFASVAILLAVVITLAFARFGPNTGGSTNRPRPAPSAWLVLIAALALCSAFQLWFAYAPRHGLQANLGLAGLLCLVTAAIALFVAWARRVGWGPVHALAASTGAILTYGWISLRRLVVLGGTALGVPTTPIDVVGQAMLLLVMLGLSYLAWWRLRRGAVIQFNRERTMTRIYAVLLLTIGTFAATAGRSRRPAAAKGWAVYSTYAARVAGIRPTRQSNDIRHPVYTVQTQPISCPRCIGAWRDLRPVVLGFPL